MTAVRAASTALFAAGLVIGSLAPAPPPPTPRTGGGYTILTADFHVHAFPGDGTLTPARLREQAARHGIDVITITNHNQLHAAAFIRSIDRDGSGPLVILGAEITNPDYHLVAVGISQFVDWDQPAARAIDEVHAQGGVAIAAHPTLAYRRGWDDEALARLDGVEAAHPSRAESDEAEQEFAEFLERARARKPAVAPVGSSDFHVHDRIGRCRTYVFARERSADGVLDALRAGRTVAEAADGRLFGDPALVTIAEAQRFAVSAPDGHRWHTIPSVFAWLGVAGLMLFCSATRGSR